MARNHGRTALVTNYLREWLSLISIRELRLDVQNDIAISPERAASALLSSSRRY